MCIIIIIELLFYKLLEEEEEELELFSSRAFCSKRKTVGNIYESRVVNVLSKL